MIIRLNDQKDNEAEILTLFPTTTFETMFRYPDVDGFPLNREFVLRQYIDKKERRQRVIQLVNDNIRSGLCTIISEDEV